MMSVSLKNLLLQENGYSVDKKMIPKMTFSKTKDHYF